MMLRLINGAGLRKVDSGLKMLIKPILFWLVASQNYKKKLKDVHAVPDVSQGQVVSSGDESSRSDEVLDPVQDLDEALDGLGRGLGGSLGNDRILKIGL